MLKRIAFTFVALFGLSILSLASNSFVNTSEHEGEQLTVDLPAREHILNIGSKIDGYGMCVFTSCEMAADWQGQLAWKGFRDWCAEKYPGGGYPEKLDRLIKAYAAAKSLPTPRMVQYTGDNPEPILELCEKTGRMPCITYGYSPRYGGSAINHMVNCVKYSGKYAVVLDNNFPGDDKYEWMEKTELVHRMKTASDSRGNQVPNPAWVFVWLNPSPPPVPRNLP